VAVEDDDRVSSAVGDVAELAVGVEGDAVRAFEAFDSADRLARRGVEDFDAAAVGDVKAVSRAVGKQIVPATFAADLPAVDDAIRTLRCNREV
jgi:hypothetical protein